jgi:hypothetical protein
VNQTLALQVFGGSAHSNIAIEFGFRGVGTTNSNSCASGTVAVGEALRYIRDDFADVVIAGGAEAPLSPLTYGAFAIIKTMSQWKGDPTEACRPFDLARDGFVMGEGGASLVIEELEHARNRGAHIYAEVLGYSLNNDAFHMTSPLPGGESCIRAMHEALADAHLAPEQIDYINAHAELDAAERQHRDDGVEAGLRRTCEPARGQRHEGIHRAPPRRDRRDRGGDLRTRARSKMDATDAEPHDRRSDVRSRRCAKPRARSRLRSRAQQFVRLRRHQLVRCSGTRARLTTAAPFLADRFRAIDTFRS